MNPKVRQYLESCGLRAEATDAEAQTFLAGLNDAQRAFAATLVPAAASNSNLTDAPAAPSAAPAKIAARSAADADPSAAPPEGAMVLENERRRVDEITRLRGANTPDDVFIVAIRGDKAKGIAPMTVDEASRAFLEAERKAKPGAPAVHVRNHETDCTADVLSAALMHRCGQPKAIPNDQLREQGQRYARMSMPDMVAEQLRLFGIEPSHDRREQVMQLSLAVGQRAAVSTLGASTIFSTSMNKMLMNSYDEYPDSTEGWVSAVDVPDFKTNDRAGFTKLNGLQKLAKGATAKHDSINEDTESYKIARYADQIVLDEQDIINDNLGALMTLPMEMGNAARRLRPDLIYSILLANAALADTITLFHASSHGANSVSGGTTALSTSSLSAGLAAVAKQTMTSPAGKVVNLNLRAAFLIVPQDLKFTAQQLISSALLIDGTASAAQGNANPVYSENLQLRVDNRIGAAGVADPNTGTSYTGTATNWFLATAGIRTIEVGYLAGSGRRPLVRSFALDKGQWGLGWDICLDIGAKALDYRGLYKSAGA